ncbi:MAG: hypothetical protein Q8K79_01545 [Solirubrobacteraceae bacterium]|nr:hypothetical protein [Solirubrobacteraceae bacterium]
MAQPPPVFRYATVAGVRARSRAVGRGAECGYVVDIFRRADRAGAHVDG